MRTVPLSFMILQGLGLWQPYKYRSLFTSLLYKFYTCIVMFGVVSQLVTGIIGVSLHNNSLMDLAGYGCRLISTTVTFGKVCTVLICRGTIMNVTEALEKDPCLPRDAEELTIQKEHNRNIRNKTISYSIVISLTVLIMVSQAIKHNIPARKLPRLAWYPYDYSHGVMYWFSFLHQVCVYVYLYIAVVAYDTLVCGLFLEISTKMNFLRHRIINLHNTYGKQLIHDNDKSNDISQIERNLIFDCVNFHRHLFNLAKQINSAFSLMILYQYALSSILISMSIYNISGSEFNAGVSYSIFFMFAAFLQVYLYCDSADEATIASGRIAQSVHSMNWLCFTQGTLKSLLIIGSTSNYLIIFKSGYFVTLSLESFKATLKVAYSAFNALNSVH